MRAKNNTALVLLLWLSALTLAASGCQNPTPAQTILAATMTPAAAPTAVPVIVQPAPVYPEIPYDLISEEQIFGYLSGFLAIQPYSGWRNTGSSGEAEALDYVTGILNAFPALKARGLELERQRYKVFASVEFWETSLFLTLNGKEIEVPADGLRGNRYEPQLALSMDSDGAANDSERNPRTAAAPLLMVDDEKTLHSLTTADVDDSIIFLDFSLVDAVTNENYLDNGAKLMKLINQGLEGVVLVTHYSNVDGESRGSFAGDGSVFQHLDHMARIPILYVRLEDLAPAGIQAWDDFASVENARMIWDQDVFIPGYSGNLIARIPGRDSSRAVILTAHVDSPNGPGAFDDGSGAAILLEIARVLDVSGAQPAVDVYLAWFGGHELLTYGSAHFVSTHPELMDRALAMMDIDGIGYPLEGAQPSLTMSFTDYGLYGGSGALWPDFLLQTVSGEGVSIQKDITYDLVADNSNFDAFNVPNFNLYSLYSSNWQSKGSAYMHYASHWHDPYESLELAREVEDQFLAAAKTALVAALETGNSDEILKEPPVSDKRALFVANHTENTTIAPGMLRDLGMALAWEGFDVDLLPYGESLTQADLDSADLVLLLPTLDYPGPNSEEWADEEFALLTDYVNRGGFMVVTNMGYNLAVVRELQDINEDMTDFNRLLKPWGITFGVGNTGRSMVRLTVDHPLTTDAKYLTAGYENHQVPMTQTRGLELAKGVIGLVDVGSQGGQVLVIADLDLLRNKNDGAKNLIFVQNIARYARSH